MHETLSKWELCTTPEASAMASANPLGGLLGDYGSDSEEDNQQSADTQQPLNGAKRYTPRSKLAHTRVSGT